MRKPKLATVKPVCSSCGSNKATRRIHNGLAAGSHCDKCWKALLKDYHSRSW